LACVTSTGDWPKIADELIYWRVDGGSCVATAEKNLVLNVECVGEAGLKARPFCFSRSVFLLHQDKNGGLVDESTQ